MCIRDSINTFFKSHSITKGKKPTHGRPCMPSSKGQRTYGAHAEGAWNVAYLCWTMKMIWNFTKPGQLYWLQRGSSISTRRSQYHQSCPQLRSNQQKSVLPICCAANKTKLSCISRCDSCFVKLMLTWTQQSCRAWTQFFRHDHNSSEKANMLTLI